MFVTSNLIQAAQFRGNWAHSERTQLTQLSDKKQQGLWTPGYPIIPRNHD